MKNYCLSVLATSALGFNALLTGCSSSPTTSDGEQAIQQRIKNEARGRIKLVEFHKTDGQSAEVNGVKLYTLEYDAEVEFLEACKWDVLISGGVLMDDELHFGTRSLTDKSSMEAAMNLGTEVAKGQMVKLLGAIVFEKKESGWAVDSVKVKSTKAIKSTHATPTTSPRSLASSDRQISSTKMVLSFIASALDTYKLNIGHYPSKEEGGLKALLVKPAYRDASLANKWQGPYLKPGTKLQDEWGNDLLYACPGERNPSSYDLMSKGPDGQIGGGDNITN